MVCPSILDPNATERRVLRDYLDGDVALFYGSEHLDGLISGIVLANLYDLAGSAAQSDDTYSETRTAEPSHKRHRADNNRVIHTSHT